MWRFCGIAVREHWVVKVYRRGITLPQSFVDRLGAADPPTSQ